MEKISGIVRPNARTRAVDVSRSQPVRPGAPTWGRPEGRVTKTPVEDKITLSSLAADRTLEPATYKNPAETQKVKIANDISQKFFETKIPQKLVKDSELTLSEEVVERVSEPTLSSVKPVDSREEIA